MKEISDKLTLYSQNKIDEALNYSKSLYDDEEERRKTIEAKANTLIATISVSTAFIIGFVGVILKEIENLNYLLLIISLLLYIIIALLLIRANVYAIRTVRVDLYYLTKPDSSDIYNLKEKAIYMVKNERAIDYYYSFLRNRGISDEKADWIIKAHKNLKNALFLLLILSILVSINIAISSKNFKPNDWANKYFKDSVQPSFLQNVKFFDRKISPGKTGTLRP